MALRETLARIRSQSPSNTVNATQIRVVLPILRDLGWDEHDPALVDLEHRDASIVLLAADEEPTSPESRSPAAASVYIKIAPPTASPQNVGPAVVAAAIRDGAGICVATNGKVWTLYCPKPTGESTDCQFAEWDIYSDPIERIARELKKYLSRQALVDRTAQALAEEALIAILDTKRLTETVPSVWRRLVTDPDPFLVEYVQGEVRDEIGLMPSTEQVAEAMRGSLATTDVRGASDSLPKVHHTPSGRRRPTGYRLWGETYRVKYQREILTGVAEAIYARHASTFDRITTLSSLFTKRPSERVSPIRIGSSAYYHEGSVNINKMMGLLHKLLQAFGHSASDVEILYDVPLGGVPAAPPRRVKRRQRRAANPPTSIRLWGEEHPITRQYDVLTIVATQLYERHADVFDRALAIGPITNNPTTRGNTMPIGDSGYYHDKAVSHSRLEGVCARLLRSFGHAPSDLELIYE